MDGTTSQSPLSQDPGMSVDPRASGEASHVGQNPSATGGMSANDASSRSGDSSVSESRDPRAPDVASGGGGMSGADGTSRVGNVPTASNDPRPPDPALDGGMSRAPAGPPEPNASLDPGPGNRPDLGEGGMTGPSAASQPGSVGEFDRGRSQGFTPGELAASAQHDPPLEHDPIGQAIPGAIVFGVLSGGEVVFGKGLAEEAQKYVVDEVGVHVGESVAHGVHEAKEQFVDKLPLTDADAGAPHPNLPSDVRSDPGLSTGAGFSSDPGMSSDPGLSQLPNMSSDPGVPPVPLMSIDPGFSQLPNMSFDPGLSQPPNMSFDPGVLPDPNMSLDPGFSQPPAAFGLGASADPNMSFDPGFSQPPAAFDPGFSQPNMPFDPGFSQPPAAFDPGFSQPNMPFDPGFSQPPAAFDPGFSQPNMPMPSDAGFSSAPAPPTPVFTPPTSGGSDY